jgi:hypothetical protein
MAVLAGCGAQEPLPPKSAKVPAGVDLSGQWELRAGSRDTNRRIAEAERQVAGANESLVPRTSSSRKAAQPDNEDVRVHVFLEAGESLRITQTDYGLFISFDRAIVEEYRFGEQRTVSVGPIEADRVSGWENNAYVIVTRDEEGALLTESYRLNGADKLLRAIRMEYDGETALAIEQVFDRR